MGTKPKSPSFSGAFSILPPSGVIPQLASLWGFSRKPRLPFACLSPAFAKGPRRAYPLRMFDSLAVTAALGLKPDQLGNLRALGHLRAGIKHGCAYFSAAPMRC